MTPERSAQILRLYLPIVVAVFLIVYGILAPNVGWIAAGSSALGVPFIAGGSTRAAS